MRRSILVACMALLLMPALGPPKASAAVSVSLRIGDPYRGPHLAFVDRPDVVLIPGTRVYYVEDTDYDLYRFGPSWYYYYDGGWYRASDYNGPFYFISYQTVPGPIRVVPVRYRHHWRSYRGPAYTYYESGRWYRQNPGVRTTSSSYNRTRTYRQSGGQPSRTVRRTTDERRQSHGSRMKYAEHRGGKGHGQGKGNGQGKEKGGHGGGQGHGD
jgi:hypothetical protein